MKNLISTTLFPIMILGIMLFSSTEGFGQTRQEDTTYTNSIISRDRQKLLNNIDVIANMNYNFRSDYLDGEYLDSRFKFEQFRLEIKGDVTDRVYFRFRHRYTSDFQPQAIDKIIKGVDFAYITVKLTDKWNFTAGKTYADWGGWEFDINPIDVFEYSDIIEQADNFLSGVGTYYQATKNHGFSAQILNSRTQSFEQIYDTVPNVESTAVPLAAVINWRGSLLNGRVTTLWSYSLFSEAKGFAKNYIALGTKYNSENRKFMIAYDFKWSQEDLDRTGIISNEIPDDIYNYSVENTLYYSHWINTTYRFAPKWQIAVTGFVDFADWLDDADPLKTEDRFRTVYSIVPTIEYYPFDELNLKFFVGGVYRQYNYSDYAKTRDGFGHKDYNEYRFMFGFISPLLIL